MENTKLHKRQNLGGETVYNYRFSPSCGMDVRLLTRQGDGRRAAYLKNLYRNKKKNKSGVESFPGYRRLFRDFHPSGELHGVYAHTFEGRDAMLLHIGSSLYRAFCDDEATTPELIASVRDEKSSGRSFGDAFYFIDGENILKIRPSSVIALGDEPYTEEMEEMNRLPKTFAYIPTLWENGKEKEARNLLTAYYDIVDETSSARENLEQFGLKLHLIHENGRDALEVYGVEPGRKILYIPNEAEVLGKRYPIVAIADGAFQGCDFRVAVISSGIKRIGLEMGVGAFWGCTSLEQVAIFGAEFLGANSFLGCTALKEMILPASLKTVGAEAFTGLDALKTVYCEGDNLDEVNFGEGVMVYSDTILMSVHEKEEIRFPLDPAIYTDIYALDEPTSEVLGKFERYGGWSSGILGDDIGYKTVAKSARGLCGIYFDSHLSTYGKRFAFLNVAGEGRPFSEKEDPSAVYDIPIPDDCRAIVSVTLDGEKIPHETLYSYEAGRTYASAIRLHLPRVRRGVVKIRIFSKGVLRGALASYYPDYKQGTAAILRQSVAIESLRDKLYLAGCPFLRGAVFSGEVVSVQGEDAPYFPDDAFEIVSNAAINALLFCRERLAVLSERGVYYLKSGVIAEEIASFSGVAYRDSRYLLLADGVYRIREGVSVSYTHLEKLSQPIDADITDYSLASLAVFDGYLVLLFGDRAYLADLDESYRDNGETLHPWYMLSELGDALCTPFSAMLSLGERLYFFTASGGVFLVDEEADGYDTRRVLSVAASEAYDMEVPYLYKKPCRKSLTLSHYLPSGSEARVLLMGDGDTLYEAGAIIGSGSDGSPSVAALKDVGERFLRGRLVIMGEKLAFESAAFRYTVLKRRVRV